MAKSNSPNLLCREQAAEYLGVKPRTLDVCVSTHRYNLKFIKVDRLAKYRKEDLLVVPNISELTLVKNITNSADIAYSAEAESKLIEVLTSLCLGLIVSPIEIRNSLSNDDITDWINTKISTEVLRTFVLSLNERKLLAQSETPNQRNTHTQNSQYTQKDRTDTPTSFSIVSCNKCEHFTPDQIGDGAGIGNCNMGVKWTKEWCGQMPLYRYAERHCEKFSKLMS